MTRDELEYWNQRCADTMPDSAQSRLDSHSDVKAIRVALVGETSGRNAAACGAIAEHWMRGPFAPGPNHEASAYLCGMYAATEAFRACPGLRA